MEIKKFESFSSTDEFITNLKDSISRFQEIIISQLEDEGGKSEISVIVEMDLRKKYPTILNLNSDLEIFGYNISAGTFIGSNIIPKESLESILPKVISKYGNDYRILINIDLDFEDNLQLNNFSQIFNDIRDRIGNEFNLIRIDRKDSPLSYGNDKINWQLTYVID